MLVLYHPFDFLPQLRIKFICELLATISLQQTAKFVCVTLLCFRSQAEVSPRNFSFSFGVSSTSFYGNASLICTHWLQLFSLFLFLLLFFSYWLSTYSFYNSCGHSQKEYRIENMEKYKNIKS